MKFIKIGILAFLLYSSIVFILYLLQEKFIFQGSELPKDYEFDIDHSFEEVFLETQDSAVVHGVLLRSDSAKGVILYFHGNRKNIVRWGNEAAYFTKYNYDVLVMDYRGYGKSHGRRTEALLHQDAQLAYDYLKQRYSDKNIVLYGRSLGTGIATKLASKTSASKLILETPYHSFSDMLITRLIVIPTRWFLKFNFNSAKYIGKVSCPIYIFHGTDDRIIPIEYGRQLAQKADQNKMKLIIIEKGSHNDLCTFAEYNKAMDEIL